MSEALGPPIAGPSALGGSPRRFAYLALTLAVTEFKLRFFGSALGYLWQLVRPLLLFGVLYFVFTEFVKIGDRVALYPVVLLANIVLFTFFQEGTSAVSSLADRESLVRKIHFPRMAIPVSVVVTAAFNLVLNLGVVLAFALASGVRPRWSWLQAPVLVALLAVFVVGLAMLLSALYVRYRDVKPIWEVVLQVLFYATPVIYAVETIDVSPGVREAIMASPVAAILEQFRHAVIDPAAPTAAEAAGGGVRVLVPLAILLLVAVLGFRVFDRAAPRIAEEL
jgi:ABC-2 type transport system permease protein